jgi:hypothetical protein
MLARQRRHTWLLKSDLIPDVTKKATELPMELSKVEGEMVIAPPLVCDRVWTLVSDRYKCQKQLDKLGRRVQELKRKDSNQPKPAAKKFKWKEDSSKPMQKGRSDSSRGRGSGRRSRPAATDTKSSQRGNKKEF